MILYYTASQKTKVFAEALGDVLRLPPVELISPLNKKSPFKFTIHALYLAVTGKGYPVDNLPDLAGVTEVYLCAPVWGGQIAGPAWFFLNNAALSRVKVNLILTCGSITAGEKYRKKALDSLQLIDCIAGEAHVFATSKEMPDRTALTEQLRVMLCKA